ncbi:hypothetical protein AB0I84_31495 [Streptomyces spectabilis]
MALRIGELFGVIDLDDSGAQRGIARTEAGPEPFRLSCRWFVGR